MQLRKIPFSPNDLGLNRIALGVQGLLVWNYRYRDRDTENLENPF